MWLWIADSVAHEVGHVLGLGQHDGNDDRNANNAYYYGHGSRGSETQWCDIMG